MHTQDNNNTSPIDDLPTCEKCGHRDTDGVGDYSNSVSCCGQFADGECQTLLCGDCFDASGHGHDGPTTYEILMQPSGAPGSVVLLPVGSTYNLGNGDGSVLLQFDHDQLALAQSIDPSATYDTAWDVLEAAGTFTDTDGAYDGMEA